MNNLPSWYDQWRTRSPEDEEDLEQARQERIEREIDKADYDRDRLKDEAAERGERP